MQELDAILEAWHGGQCGGAVLTTVVHVRGSAYRRPGARMLIFPGGRRIGSVSGGCLEGDVCKKAWWFTEGGRPSVRIYDTSSDDDAVFEFGLGCNGVVHVLFERTDSPRTKDMLGFLAAHRKAGRVAVVATVTATADASLAQVGDRLLVASNGADSGPLHGSALREEVLVHAASSLSSKQSHLAHLDGCDVFIECVLPPVPVVVFGAGHDAVPLVRIAKQMGWHVTVADGRANFARPERFPEADKVVLLDPGAQLNSLNITAETIVVVVMTHNYPQDVRLVEQILPLAPRYLGLLGPEARAERLFAELGETPSGSWMHAPTGLDIGAETPEAIALSIAAEIQSVLASRDGGRLKWRGSPIHAPAEESGSPDHRLEIQAELAVCELI